MTLKKINPEDLVEGREYYVKMKLHDTDVSSVPFCFKSVDSDDYWLPNDQPIYTLEQSTDTELEMLVNVAGGFHMCGYGEYNECAEKALDLITACKNALKEVSND